jgi:mannose-1-phosphate guanylyltransferase
MYVLQRSVLGMIEPESNVSIERDVFPRLTGDGLYGVLLEGYWVDIGTPERYLQASWDILEGRVKTQVEPSGPGMLVAADAEVAADATVEAPAVLGPGCRVEGGAEVRGSVLLDGCTVGAGAKIAGSILGSGVQVAPGASLEGDVVGENERVAAP